MFSFIDIAMSEWEIILNEIEDSINLAAIRKSTLKGFPFAEEKVLKELEIKLGRSLKPNPVGRPKIKLGTATN